MSDPAVRARLKKLREDYARLEAAEAEVVANAKSEQEALEIYLRRGIDAETSAMFAAIHGEHLAENRLAQKAA